LVLPCSSKTLNSPSLHPLCFKRTTLNRGWNTSVELAYFGDCSWHIPSRPEYMDFSPCMGHSPNILWLYCPAACISTFGCQLQSSLASGNSFRSNWWRGRLFLPRHGTAVLPFPPLSLGAALWTSFSF